LTNVVLSDRFPMKELSPLLRVLRPEASPGSRLPYGGALTGWKHSEQVAGLTVSM
jgi:hypothetical protein